MAAKQTEKGSTRARARVVAREGEKIRDRVHELTVKAFRDRKLSGRDLPGLVDEVLEGAAEGVRESIPESRTSVLRQVFEGLSDGVDAITSAGTAVAKDVRQRGKGLADRDLSAAGRHVKAANEEFLQAVSNFAGRVSHEVRAELDGLVARARRAGPCLLYTSPSPRD